VVVRAIRSSLSFPHGVTGMDGGAYAAPRRISSRHAARQVSLSACALADRAVDALVQEALLTPKPALVDRRGSGAHTDLDLLKMLRSAHALHGCFRAIAEQAWGEAPSQRLRETLAATGRHGERDMLSATGGANTHRGAVWTLGLLLAAAAAARGARRHAEDLAAWAAALASYSDRAFPLGASHGTRACVRYGVSGARGEAAAGFPHVMRRALPALAAARWQGQDEQACRINALLAIMAGLDDTCLLHRGGRLALETAQTGACAVLAAGGAATAAGRAELLRLDRTLMALNASPGGSADLLAATLLLDSICLPSSCLSSGERRLNRGKV
jgi:triphosphoribosyl-dephospho-CoA synthase